MSKSLVSLVLQGSPRVSEQRREAVLRAVAELGYRPDPAARSLAERRTRTVGVVVDDLHNPWFVDVLDGLRPVLEEHGLRPLLGDGRSEPEVVGTLTRLRVDGLILVGTLPRGAGAATRGTPTVVAGGREPLLPHVDVVANDDAQGVRLAVRHLLELGHRRIAHVVGTGRVGELRRQSYESEMRAAGSIPFLALGDMTESGGQRAAHRLLRGPDRPTAVLAANDLSALGVLAVADELSLRVPQDLSLVGYDNTSLARIRHLSLTSVDNASAAVGSQAAEALVRRMAVPDAEATTRLLPPRLVVRNSTAPPAD